MTEPGAHEEQARTLFNRVWELLEEDRTPDGDVEMLHAAHASRHHWWAAGAGPVRLLRGEWQISRVYATLGRPEPALVHARLALELGERQEVGAFDTAYAHEAAARAYLLAGTRGAARRHVVEARRLLDRIDDDEHRGLLEADLAAIEL
jgi:hypothetical protein